MPRVSCRYTLSIIFFSTFLLTQCKSLSETKNVVSNTSYEYLPFVNPFIGTEGNGTKHSVGNVHPGAVRPWGMVSVNPQSFDFTKMISPSGFRYEEEKIYGFSNVNFSGVGCPATGSVPFKFFTRDLVSQFDGSRFSEQKSQPGYYSVKLDEENIRVHATSTKRTTLYKLELPAGKSMVYLDLMAQQGHIKGGVIENHTSKTVNGYQLEGHFCGSKNRSSVYFSAEMSKNADATFLKYNNKSDKRFNQDLEEKASGIIYVFENKNGTTLYLKVGISFVSTANAKENLYKEQDGFEFEKIKKASQDEWENELSKIKVTSSSTDYKTIFYTGLYHSLLMPITYSDFNGEYLKMGSTEVKKTNYTRYTGFSLWDTYRTTHPLLTLVYPQRQEEFVKNMLDIYDESGWLPKWSIFNFETFLMVGDPAPIVIGDTYVKGIRGFDINKAYESVTKNANEVNQNLNRRGLKDYLSLGYISMDGEFSDVKNFQWNNGIVWGAVSNTMEFNLADYNIAQLANTLGNQKDYQKYLHRSKSFMSLYNDKNGFIQPKNKNGSWYEPFDPSQELWDKMNFGLRGGPGFVEGSAYQYLFSIPHGIDSLKKRMGEDLFLKKLDTIFEKKYFDMTNEPGFGFPFFYNLTKERDWKTAKTVHGLINQYFTNTPNGLPGNDDAGAMSSWLVFAMMGLYPSTPGDLDYMVTSPILDKIEIQLDQSFYKGGTLVIKRNGPSNGRIKSLKLNGTEVPYTVDHNSITTQKSTITIETEKLAETGNR